MVIYQLWLACDEPMIEDPDKTTRISFCPRGVARTGGAVLTDQLGTPRGRCDEHSSKFFLSYETKV
jgi:hypothetical protein